MIRRAFLLLLIALFIAGIGYFGWRVYQASFNPSLIVKEPVKLAWDEWPGMLSYWVAYDKGYFTAEGIDVRLVKMASDDEMINDLVDGKVDFAPDIDIVYVVNENSRGNVLQIVGVTDISTGGDAIVAKPGVDSVAQLKGKRIAVERASLSEKLLFYALQKNNMSLSDVTLADLDAVAAVDALLAGEADAAVTYEPNVARAVGGGNHIIFSSSQTPGLLIDTLVARKAYIDANAASVTALLRAYFRAVQYIKDNPQDAYAIGARYLGISENEFIASYRGLLQADIQQNLNSFSYSSGYDSLYGNGFLTNQYLDAINEIGNPIDIEDTIRPEFVRKINLNQ